MAIYFYSVLKDLTGLANAALIACELTVISAIKNAIAPAAINIHQPILILYTKSSNQLCIAHQAIGNANTEDINTRMIKSLLSIFTTFPTLAPNTFLIPISFVLCSAI